MCFNHYSITANVRRRNTLTILFTDRHLRPTDWTDTVVADHRTNEDRREKKQIIEIRARTRRNTIIITMLLTSQRRTGHGERRRHTLNNHFSEDGEKSIESSGPRQLWDGVCGSRRYNNNVNRGVTVIIQLACVRVLFSFTFFFRRRRFPRVKTGARTTVDTEAELMTHTHTTTPPPGSDVNDRTANDVTERRLVADYRGVWSVDRGAVAAVCLRKTRRRSEGARIGS